MKKFSESKGTILNGKGINFPGIDLDVSVITEKDMKDIEAAIKLNIDWLAMSFVRSADDMIKVKDILDNKNHDRKYFRKTLRRGVSLDH